VIPTTVDPSKIKASLKAGVLRIVAARSERIEPVSAGGHAPGQSR
jgi:HSP20 family molecular chaperone IbpA